MQDFMNTALKGVILLGLVGIIAGCILICAGQNLTAGVACIAIGSNALSAMAGFMVAPKTTQQTPLAVQLADAQAKLADVLTQTLVK